MGKIDYNKCLVTFLERQTRKSYAIITKRGSKRIYQALNNMIKKFGLNIKYLIVDNGKKNVLYTKSYLEKDCSNVFHITHGKKVPSKIYVD